MRSFFLIKYCVFVISVLLIANSIQAYALTPQEKTKVKARIYTWVNKDGNTVFSDSPKAGAEEVEVNESNTTYSADTSKLDLTPKIIKDDYQVVIHQPKQNDTLRDNTGSVYVSGSIKPIFKKGLNVQLYLDDKPYGKPQPHSMFVLRNVDRGEHVIKMKILNNKGKIIALSESVTFYLHRASVNKAN